MTKDADGGRISLLVSDVDGTLVTTDKRLMPAVVAAAAELAAAGVRLSLVSSRPPMGFASLRKALQLTAPLGAFNGGAILDRDGGVVESTPVPAGDARLALDAFAEFGLDGWLFTLDRWHVTDPDGALVPKEKLTISAEPTVVASFDGLLDQVGKLVGSSHDHAAVAACEAALARRLGPGTVAKRSQPYYVDVTPAGFDKGVAARRIAALLGVPMDEVAVIGDAANDLPMFAVAEHRIAMGNGLDELKRAASFVTDSNERDGWAMAVTRYILPRAAASRRSRPEAASSKGVSP